MNPENFEYLLEPEKPADLRRTLKALDSGASERIEAAADGVLKVLFENGKFYHVSGRPSFRTALYFNTTSRELELVHSDRFLQAVSDRFEINRASRTWRYVLRAIENASIGRNSEAIEPEAFWASRTGAVYISNGPGSMVRIRASGFDVVDNGTDGVLFPHGATLAPWELMEPEDPFERCDLFRGLNATAGHGGLLAKLWVLSLPTAPRSKPPLVLAGEIGSGKTRFARGILELFGICEDGRTISVDAAGEDDFWPLMDAGGMAILDNADTRISWLPDALAQASTGLASTKRELYTNANLVRFRPRSWVCITTARPEGFAGDPGLADRLIVVRMGRREADTKDQELSQQIAAARDAGLSWVCSTLSRALGDTVEFPSPLNQRHPDFGTLALKLGRALGREQEAIEALQSAETDKSNFCLENDPIGTALVALVKEKEKVKGPAKDILKLLQDSGLLDGGSAPTPKGLGKRLDSLWPHLQSVMKATRSKDRTGAWVYEFQTKPATRLGRTVS